MKSTFPIKMILLLLLFTVSCENREELTGPELLDKVINYYDPSDKWNSLQGKFDLNMTYADSSSRDLEIILDFPNSGFVFREVGNDFTKTLSLKNGDCNLQLNDSSTFTEEEKEIHNLTCENAKRLRDYYSYTLGLPMKLKDPGTVIHKEIDKKKFQGKEYFRLKVTYDKKVGKDTWYYYVNPESFQLKYYQFFHDETANDGEYITLSEEEVLYRGIRFPKLKKWYFNSNDEFLGNDEINSIVPIDQ